MKIILVGAGRTGCALIRALSGKDHDITVVDKQKSLVDAITDQYSVDGIVGSGASKETLRKAGAEAADILIALTPVDEINLLSCMQAKAVGTKRTVARVFQPDFGEERKVLEREQGIDYIFNPKYDMAEEAAASIGFPGIVKPEGVFGDYMQMITVTVMPGSPLEGRTLMEIRKELDANILVTTVLREDKLYVPDGSFRVEAGDRIGVAAGTEEIMETIRKVGIIKNRAKHVMIVGGGITAEYLTRMLLKKKKSITIVESELERCRELMEEFPSVNVSYGHGEMSEILEDEHIASMDAVVSLTNTDEINLVTSMYAWSRNVPSILTRIDAPAHLNLLHRINLDITISASEISVDKLIRFIYNCMAGDAPNEIEKYCSIADNKADVLQFTAGESFKKPGVLFKEAAFRLKKNVLIASVIRGEEVIIPGGNTCIQCGDRVVVVSDKKNHIENLNEIFA